MLIIILIKHKTGVWLSLNCSNVIISFLCCILAGVTYQRRKNNEKTVLRKQQNNIQEEVNQERIVDEFWKWRYSNSSCSPGMNSDKAVYLRRCSGTKRESQRRRHWHWVQTATITPSVLHFLSCYHPIMKSSHQ